MQGCRGSLAVSVPRHAIGPHVIVEQIVRHLRTAHLARLDVEPVVNAAPDAAVGLVIAKLKEARVRLCEYDRVAALYHVAAKVCASLPSTSASMREAPVPMQVMLLEYAGYGGVGISGVHPVSALVAGLSSRSACAIAVSGRHSR